MRKPIQYLKNCWQNFRDAMLRIYNSNGSPHEVALGAAFGAFWGVFPTFGLSTPLVLLMRRFIRFQIIAAFAGALISNPLTSPFWLYTSYLIGVNFIPSDVPFSFENWTSKLPDFGMQMLIGTSLLSLVVSVLVYVVVYKVKSALQTKIENKTNS